MAKNFDHDDLYLLGVGWAYHHHADHADHDDYADHDDHADHDDYEVSAEQTFGTQTDAGGNPPLNKEFDLIA